VSDDDASPDDEQVQDQLLDMEWLGDVGSSSSSESEQDPDSESVQELKYAESRRRNLAKKIPRPLEHQGYVSFSMGIADRTVKKKREVMKPGKFSLLDYKGEKRRVASKKAVLDFLAEDLESKDCQDAGIVKGYRAKVTDAREFGPMRLRGPFISRISSPQA
jgi:hypothetical protein